MIRRPCTADSENPEANISGAGGALIAALFILAWCAGAVAARWVGLWMGIGGTALLIGLAAVIWRRALLRDLLRPSGRLLWMGLAAGAVMLAGTYGLFPLAVRLNPGLGIQTGALYHTFGAVSPLTLALLPLIICSEELVWRGVVQQALETRYGKIAAAILAAIVYAAAHAPAGAPLLCMLALVCGLYWSGLRAYSGSLVPSLVSHLIWDIVVFALAPLK